MIFNFIKKYMNNYFGYLFFALLLFFIILFLYVKIHVYLNKDLIYEVEGNFVGVLAVRGSDSKEKKIILIEKDGELLRFSTFLVNEEYRYLSGYKGKIFIFYKASPFGTVWITELRLEGKTFK